MNFKRSLLATSAALCLTGSAHAAFFVNEDAPAVTAVHPEAARKDKRLYIPFSKGRLSSASRAHLDSTIESYANLDSVSITTYAASRKALPAAQRRVAVVRSLMLRRGIPLEQINASAEVDPYIDPSDTDVQVVFKASTQRPTIESMRAARFVAQPLALPVSQQVSAPIVHAQQVFQNQVSVQPSSMSVLPTQPPQQGPNAATLAFVKKIMAMAQSKLITQESAVRLVNEYLANLPPQSSGGALPDGGQAQSLVPATPQIVPFGEVPRVWTLAANKSLRDNLREWAITAGYSEPSWAASNLYQITYTSSFTGTFLEVLNQVANSVPTIDFKVSRNRRTIEVVDAAR
jgi:hypothetical protein